jgi:hypothetical protein
MERTTNLSTFNAQTPVLSSTTMSALINNQKLSFLALSYKYTIFNIPYVVVNLARCISCFMFIICHYSISGPKAAVGKQKFEQLAATFGIKIKSECTDNGIMAKKEVMQ